MSRIAVRIDITIDNATYSVERTTPPTAIPGYSFGSGTAKQFAATLLEQAVDEVTAVLQTPQSASQEAT